MLGARIMAIDAAARVASVSDGRQIGFGKLVWAAGGRPRPLGCRGGDLAGVHVIRSRADVDRLMAELPEIHRVAVIGGGYIGLETAAVLSKLGKTVILFEALDRVLARVSGETLSRFYEEEHRSHGVDLRLEAKIAAIDGVNSKVSGVVMDDGEIIVADAVIVGIGIAPEIGPLQAAGALCSNGVEVDAFCRTSLPDVFAIGDCAAHKNSFAEGERIRLESVQNANDQAATVARYIVGSQEPYEALPWFWSDQYDLRLQTIGLSAGHDEVIVRGSPESRSFTIAYLRGGGLIAFDCVNAARDFSQARALVRSAARPDRVLLADPAISLKSVTS